MIKPKSIFDIINEAEDDDTGAENADAGNDTNAGGDDNADAGDDSGNDEDFSVDADLGDEDMDTEDSGGDEDPMGDDGGGDDSSSDSSDSGLDSSSDDNSDTEPVKANTDIFSSLTAEEQKLKIGELKKQFATLYASLDTMSEKINNIDEDAVDIEVINRITSAIYKFKTCIGEYINSIYDNKSYIENKVQYMKFIMIINAITSVVEKVSKNKERSS